MSCYAQVLINFKQTSQSIYGLLGSNNEEKGAKNTQNENTFALNKYKMVE
jgi:hypothetical protein